jgi:hypothetical protein
MRASAAVLCLCLLGCVENEEEVVVGADGSLDVAMRSKGNPKDLVGGYPLPLDGPWRAQDETTLRWIERIGPDTGSAASAAQFDAGRWEVGEKDETTLAVAAHFRSAADLPRLIAPESEPYRTAHLDRETTLVVEHKGARTVYTFQRTFGARRWRDWQVLSDLDEHLPEDVMEPLSNSEPLSDAQWATLTEIVRGLYRDSAAAFARDALTAVYTQGDASLPTAAIGPALAEVDRSVVELVTEARLRDVYAAALASEDDELDPALNPDLLVRDTLRQALRRSLAASAVEAATVYAVLGRLEWNFTAFDQTTDLCDEKFAVSVEMPGVVVLGNYGELEGSRASWSFEGQELRDQAKVLRVVSVVE